MPRAILVEGDCLEVLRSLPTGSVDLVLGSPPYGDCRTYGINFNLKGEDWVRWAVERYIECYRVSRGAVVWVVEGKTKDFRYEPLPAMLAADLHRAGVSLRSPPIFHRVGVSGSGGKDWFRNDKEFCVAASHGKLPWADNTACGHPPKWAPGGDMSHRMASGRSVARTQTMTRADGVELQGYNPPKIANPGNLIQQTYTADEVASLLEEASDVTHHLVGGGRMGDKECHENEAPFPESLGRFFIASRCPPAGIVADPFCGSGTTARVALTLGRDALGIDVRGSQLELTERRLLRAFAAGDRGGVQGVSVERLDRDVIAAALLERGCVSQEQPAA